MEHTISIERDGLAQSRSGAGSPSLAGRRWLTVVTGAIGVAMCIALAWHVGLAALGPGMARALPWLPWLVLLELGRPLCELLATGALLDAYEVRVGWRARMRAQWLAHALDVVMPAGRVVAETGKAAVLSAEINAPRAIALGAAGQTLTLLTSAVWTGLGLGIALLGNVHHALLAATLLYTLGTLSLVLAIVVVAWMPLRFAWIARVPHVRPAAEELLSLARAPKRNVLCSMLGLWAGRALQALQLSLLLWALGGVPSVVSTAVMNNLYVVSAAAGELVPAQLGVIDGAFAASSGSFDLGAEAMLGISLGLHVTQLLGAAISAGLFALSGGAVGSRSASCRSSA